MWISSFRQAARCHPIPWKSWWKLCRRREGLKKSLGSSILRSILCIYWGTRRNRWVHQRYLSLYSWGTWRLNWRLWGGIHPFWNGFWWIGKLERDLRTFHAEHPRLLDHLCFWNGSRMCPSIRSNWKVALVAIYNEYRSWLGREIEAQEKKIDWIYFFDFLFLE